MKLIFNIAVLLCFCVNGIGQGIYKTAQDFENRQLSYSSYRIAADRAFNTSSIRATDAGSSVTLEKSDLYGYQDRKKQNFRFFEDKNYRVVHHQPFMVYSREEYVVKGKEKRRVTKHYFSVDAQSPVQELNKWNLKKSWPLAHDFHDLLDLHFHGDGHLLKYDGFRNEYTLLHIFNQTVQVAEQGT